MHLVEYPLGNKEELLGLSEHQNHLRAHDEHYGFWHKRRIHFYIRQLPKKVAASFGMGSNPPFYKTFEYEISFWRSHEALFLGLMAFCQQLADHHGFKPVSLLQQHKRSLEYLMGGSPDQLKWTPVFGPGEK